MSKINLAFCKVLSFISFYVSFLITVVIIGLIIYSKSIKSIIRFLAFRALTVNNLTVFLNNVFIITFFRLSLY